MAVDQRSDCLAHILAHFCQRYSAFLGVRGHTPEVNVSTQGNVKYVTFWRGEALPCLRGTARIALVSTAMILPEFFPPVCNIAQHSLRRCATLE